MIPISRNFSGWALSFEHVELCIPTVLISKVIFSSIFRLLFTSMMFGSLSASVPHRHYHCIFWFLFLLLHMFRARLWYNSSVLVMYSKLGLESLPESTVWSFKAIFNSFNCYLLSQVVTFLNVLGFCNPSLIFVQHNYF